MLDTYKAILKGNRVIWADETPVMSLHDQEIEILVTILMNMNMPPLPLRQRGEAMARCLEKLAKTGGIQGIPDPVVWQREIRKDRALFPEKRYAHYFVSQNFDSTKLEDVTLIYKHLVCVKQEILSMVEKKNATRS